MNKNKYALFLIREMIDRAYKYGALQELWDILEGIRGPDATKNQGKSILKDNYITPVRKAFLTKDMAKHLGVSGWQSFLDKRQMWSEDNIVKINDCFPDKRNHTRRHAIKAAQVINDEK